MTKDRLKKILVIEDDRFTRDLLQQELRELGYEVSSLQDGKDAAIKATAIAPDLILLDVMMPQVDGYQVCQALRKEPGTAELPIIFITAKDTPRDVVHGLTVGANDYVGKPIDMEILAARIRTQLRTKHLMDEVTAQKKELEKLNKTIKEFLGMASHDLRTPASIIGLLSDTLLDKNTGPLNEAQKSLLTRLHQQAKFMNRLLNDLLTISHIESGKISIHLRPENLNELLQENLSSHTFMAKSKSIAISLQTDSSLPPVPLDKLRFAEIIDNIVSNAIKFTPQGGKITVKTGKQDAPKNGGYWACVSIADTGVGIAPEDLQRLFQAFASGRRKATDGEKSTGLGLSIAKKLTELHQGKIEAHSRVGTGTEFVIKIPLKT